MNKIFVDLIGCFKDSNKRVLEGGRTWNNHMTVSQCRKRCEKENSKFYGLEVKAKRGISYHTTLYINFKKKTQGKHCFRVYISFFYRLGMNVFVGILCDQKSRNRSLSAEENARAAERPVEEDGGF